MEKPVHIVLQEHMDLELASLDRKRCSIVVLGPNAALAGRQNSLRVQSVLDLLVQLHVGAVVEIVGLRDLVHQRQVGAVLAPTSGGAVVHQRSDQPVGAATHLGVLAVENDGNDVVELAHADHEGADEICPRRSLRSARGKEI